MTHFSTPVALDPQSEVDAFCCGEESLDDWLHHRAKQNQASGASRTFVTCTNAGEIAGFYCLAAGSISRETAPKKLTRNAPNPVPVFILARLAVDLRFQGQGVGASLLQQAILQAGTGLRHVGASALLVHALNESAINFYVKFGFTQSGFDSRTLFLPSSAIPNI